MITNDHNMELRKDILDAAHANQSQHSCVAGNILSGSNQSLHHILLSDTKLVACEEASKYSKLICGQVNR